MSRVTLQRQLMYRLGQLGPVGSLGLVLLLLAALGWFGVIRSGQRELESARSRLAALQQQVASQSRSGLSAGSALDREEQLQLFYRGFPKAGTVADALSRIYSASSKRKLALETGEYSWSQNGQERLARYRIALPVKGSFAQVLAFMDQVLQDNNRLALENASFKRDKVDDPLVEAKLVFVVFVDKQP